MALSVKHAFTSAKADGTDATKVQPSNWNAEHTLVAAVDSVLGTDSGGTTVKELACTAAGRALIDDANAAAQKVTLSVAEVPIGGGYFWFDDSLPPSNGSVVWGWANGQEIDRGIYATLFALWGTRFGVGNGTTTFNVPNGKGRYFAGKDTMGGTAAAGLITTAGGAVDGATLGAVGGGQNLTLATGQIPQMGVTFDSTTIGISFPSASIAVSLSGTITGTITTQLSGQTNIAGGSGIRTAVKSVDALTTDTTVNSISINYSGLSASFNATALNLGGNGFNASTLNGHANVGAASPSVVKTLPPTFICNYVIRLA